VPVPNDASRPPGGTLDIGSIVGAHEFGSNVGGHEMAHASGGSAGCGENTLPALIGTIELKVFHDSFIVEFLIIDVPIGIDIAQKLRALRDWLPWA
jgi:hypothetical protein